MSNVKNKIARWIFKAVLLGSLIVAPLLTFAENDAENSSSECIDFEQNSLSAAATFFKKTAEDITGSIADTDLNDIFSTGTKAPGEDLYLLIHAKFNSRPYSETVRLMAERFNYPEQDVEGILSGAISPIMLNSGRQLTHTEANERLAKFSTAFQEELERQGDLLEVEMDLVPTEIFANDDVSDSGFDLITDLDKIEDILFGLSTIERMNFAYANTTTSLSSDNDEWNQDSDSTGSSDNNTAKTTGSEDTDNDDTNDDTDEDNSQADEDEKTDDSSSTGVSRTSSPNESLDPHACSESVSELTALVDSVLSAENADNSDNEDEEDDEEDSEEKVSREASASGSLTSDSSTSTPDSSVPSGYKDSDGADINLSKPTDWTGALSRCSDFFCLEITMENEARSVFPDDENCVSCHVGSINDNLYDTLSQNLLPSKITGNLFEPPMCKKAAADQMPPGFLKESPGGLITITTKPISTPIDDDIVTKLDFKKSWEELLTHPGVSTLSLNQSSLLMSETERYFEFCDKDMSAEEKQKSGCTESLGDIYTKLALENAPKGSTYQDIMLEDEELVNQSVRAAQKKASRAKTEIKTKIKSEWYQYLKPEIDQMQAYFKTFLGLITDIKEKSSKKLAEKDEID